MSLRSTLKQLVGRPRLERLAQAVGYDTRPWARIVMYEEMDKLLAGLPLSNLDCVEISGTQYQGRPFRSYAALHYPAYDVCAAPLPVAADLIIADQIWEHLLWPYKATRHVYEGLRPGGHFLVATPFLIRVHANPTDCSRWTETGLKHLLAECGFPLDAITTGSWGNADCLQANLKVWARRGFGGSLAHDPNLPVVVWALARKPA